MLKDYDDNGSEYHDNLSEAQQATYLINLPNMNIKGSDQEYQTHIERAKYSEHLMDARK